MSPYLFTDIFVIGLCLGCLAIILHLFIDLKGIGKRIRYKLEMKKKCLGTKPCQCCAYWNVRKEYCALERQLKDKYKLID